MNTEKVGNVITPKAGLGTFLLLRELIFLEKNQTMSNLQAPYGMTSNFTGSMNPNNQAMMATGKDYKIETTKLSGLKGLETVSSSKLQRIFQFFIKI